MVVGIADNRRTLGSAITHGIRELDTFEELLHLLVECSTTDNDLIEASAKRVLDLLTDLLVYLTVEHRHVKEQTHATVLYLREHLLADDLLDNERHGNDMAGLISENAWAMIAGLGTRVR